MKPPVILPEDDISTSGVEDSSHDLYQEDFEPDPNDLTHPSASQIPPNQMVAPWTSSSALSCAMLANEP